MLLIDEVDRSDEEFEAFLLEVLSEHQVSIPEIGTLRAAHEPCVVLDVESHTRAFRGAQASLPLPLDRLPDARERARDRTGEGAGRR